MLRRTAIVLICLFITGSLLPLAVPVSSVEEGETLDIRAKKGVNDTGRWRYENSYDFGRPEISPGEEGYRVRMEDTDLLKVPGKPVLPMRSQRILLPPGRLPGEVSVRVPERIDLPGRYDIETARAPLRLSLFGEGPAGGGTGTGAEPERTEDGGVYPGSAFDNKGVQTYRGYNILYLNLYPVQYSLSAKELHYYPSIEVTVRTEKAAPDPELPRPKARPGDAERVKAMVDNPEGVKIYGETRGGGAGGPALADWDMVIITNRALNNSTGKHTFADLADHRTSRGVRTKIALVEDIYANYNGSDDQEKIRNFILYAYNNWGTEYVLLGGDGDGRNVGGESENTIVPARLLVVSPGNGTPQVIASDLYYACLDGSYDFDGDGNYGEPNDGEGGGEVDMLAEVYVGRAPVDSDAELSNFVNKTIRYDLSSERNVTKSVLFLGEYLGFGGVADWGGNYKDEVKNRTSSYGYNTSGLPDDLRVAELYERDTNWTDGDLEGYMNKGLNYINHLGHANNYGVMKLSTSEADSLTNSHPFFAYSQGCYAGSFDNMNTQGNYVATDSVAEHLIGSAGGAFAVVMNSRYGWGAYDLNGPSQRLDREFFDAVYGENIREIGKANQDSKEDSVSAIGNYQQLLRYCIYEANLLGDPAVGLKEPVKYLHDVAASNLRLRDPVPYTESAEVSCDISNDGLSDENNVVADLTVGGATVNTTTVPVLRANNSTTVRFTWTPASTGTFRVGVKVRPVPAENDTSDNAVNRTVEVIAYPDIRVRPDRIEALAETGERATETLSVENTGPAPLNYSISVEWGRAGNYSVTNLTSQWTDGVTGGTPLNLGDDDHSTVNLPFQFKFYDHQWDRIHICSNGWAGFSNASDRIPGSIDFPSNDWDDTVMVLGDDWDPGDGGDVYVRSLTSPSRFVITWYNVAHYDSGGSNDFQIVLYDNGLIDLNYGGLPTVSGWEVGLNEGDGIRATEYGGPLPEHTTLRFRMKEYQGDWLSAKPVKGRVDPKDEHNIDIFANASRLSPGAYLKNLTIFSDDPDEGRIVIPVNFTVSPAAHDIMVTELIVPPHAEAGKAVLVNATVLNQGLNDEASVEIRLEVDKVRVNSTTLSGLAKGESRNISLSWIPMEERIYEVGVRSMPVPDETGVYNNWLNDTISVTTEPDIAVSPSSFDITALSDMVTERELSISNRGMDDLYYNVSASGEGKSHFEEGSMSLLGSSNVTDLNIGFRFLVNTPDLYVTGLGRVLPYDVPATVTLWADDGEKLLQEVVGPGEGWRWASVEPYRLRHNEYYRITVFCEGEFYHGRYSEVNVSENDELDYMSGVYSYDSANDFPNYYDHGNIGGVPDLHFTVGTPAEWLSVSPASGALKPDGDGGTTLIFNTSGLDKGDHSANLTVLSNDPGENAIVMPVTMKVVDAPVPDAGEDVTVNQHTYVEFDASETLNKEVVRNWTWGFPYGGELVKLYGVNPGFLFDLAGEYTLTLKTTDLLGNEYSDSLVVKVRDITAPVADAGPPLAAENGTLVTFNGSGCTDNVGIANYTWVFTYDGEEIVLHTRDPRFVFARTGVYNVLLYVSDPRGNWDVDTTEVRVYDDTAPKADAGSDIEIEQHETALFNANGSWDDTGIASYAWSFRYDGSPVSLGGMKVNFTFHIPGSYEVVLEVKDTGGNGDKDRITVEVKPLLGPAVFFDESQKSAHTGDDFRFRVVCDVSGHIRSVRVNWSQGGRGGSPQLETGSDNRSWSGIVALGPEPSPLRYNISIVDTHYRAYTMGPTEVEVHDNDPPQLVPGPDRTVEAGTLCIFDAGGSTDNAGELNYTWTFTYNGTDRRFYGRDPRFKFDIPGNYTVRLTLRDGAGNTATDITEIRVLRKDLPDDTPGDGDDEKGSAVEEEGKRGFFSRDNALLLLLVLVVIGVSVFWFVIGRAKGRKGEKGETEKGETEKGASASDGEDERSGDHGAEDEELFFTGSDREGYDEGWIEEEELEVGGRRAEFDEDVFDETGSSRYSPDWVEDDWDIYEGGYDSREMDGEHEGYDGREVYFEEYDEYDGEEEYYDEYEEYEEYDYEYGEDLGEEEYYDEYGEYDGEGGYDEYEEHHGEGEYYDEYDDVEEYEEYDGEEEYDDEYDDVEEYEEYDGEEEYDDEEEYYDEYEEYDGEEEYYDEYEEYEELDTDEEYFDDHEEYAREGEYYEDSGEYDNADETPDRYKEPDHREEFHEERKTVRQFRFHDEGDRPTEYSEDAEVWNPDVGSSEGSEVNRGRYSVHSDLRYRGRLYTRSR